MMDSKHCCEQAFRALRPPLHFAYPDSLRPAVEGMAQAISDLPVDPHIAANMFAGLVNLAHYIGDGCFGYRPPVAPPKPAPAPPVAPAPVEPEPVPAAVTPEPDAAPPAEATAESVGGTPPTEGEPAAGN